MKSPAYLYRLFDSLKTGQKASGTSFLLVLLFLIISFFNISGAEKDINPVLPPVALCKNITVQLGPGGSVTISGSDVNSGSYDPDGTITSLVVTPNTFSCAQIGSNPVILTVTDDEGLSSTCNATVTVEDRTPPVMICKNFTVSLNASGSGTVTAADLNNGSSDNCPGGLSLFLNRSTFSCTEVGSPVPVTLVGTDASGNSSSCISQVTVVDMVPPVINSKPFNLVLGSSGTAGLLPSDIDNGTFDNCGGVTLSVSPDSFDCSDLGENVVSLTAVDSNGNSSSRNVSITVSSTLEISNMTLSSCDLAPTLALFSADPEGGDGAYSFFWRGLDPASKPFMVIIPFPPSLQLSNTSILVSPFYNISLPAGLYDIRLVVTDGKGCRDSSDITIRSTGAVFNNQTIRYSEACEGEVRIYSVDYKGDATYSWSVTNGTILNSDPDTSMISVMWNMGVIQGRVFTTIQEPNVLFPGSQCESTVVDTVSITTIPVPAFIGPATNACANSVITYTLTNTYPYQNWTVNGGVITAGGNSSDNFVSVWWGNGPAGSISVSAGNNSLCTGSIVLNVNISNLTGSITSTTNITCNGGSDGSVTAQATAGTGLAPYSYSVDGGPYQAGGTFTGLSIGNHTVRIRDALLCTFDLQFIINQPLPLSGAVSAQTNVSCFGGSDGSATIAASGGVQPYQYRLNAGPLQGSNVFTGLSAGSYTITVLDNNGCSVSVLVTINQPLAPLNGSASVTNVSCFGGATGRIDLTVSGGTQPYSYLWNNGVITEDINNLPAGNYSVAVTDSKGCSIVVLATVSQPAAPLTGTVIVTDVLCFGGTTGAVNLTVSGGIMPYSFLWTNGAITEDITNIPSGSYSVIITDANSCTASVPALVGQPLAPLGGSVISQSNVSCFGGNNGIITVGGTGGTGPYNYQLGAGAFQSNGTFASLSAGTYNITIRDAHLCTFILPVTITGPAAPLSGIIALLSDVLCFGDNSGSVTVAGSGGTAPYEYNIDGGAYQSSPAFSGLSAGAHTVIIRDNNLCTFTLPVTINQPASSLNGSVISQTNVGCFGAMTGSATVSGSGGVAPYTYSIDGGPYQASGLFTALGAGVHSVTVRDFNLCLYPVSLTITQPAAPLAVTISHTDVLCVGGTTGTATASVSGGTPPYTYLWNSVPPATGASVTGLPAGNYTVTVTDINGCVSSANVSVLQPSAALAATTVVTGVSCNGGTDGAINLTVSNGTSPFTFLWSNGASTEDITGLAPGTYSVSVTDVNGCTANGSGTVTEPLTLTGSIAVTNVSCFGTNTGSLDLTVSGGTLPNAFIWSNGAVTEDINNLSAGNYSVTVTDSRGCALILNSAVTQPPSAVTGSITSQTNVSAYGGNDGSVTVTGSGGTPAYQYSIGGGTYQISGTFGTLSAGSYLVTVRDAALCLFNVPVTITQPQLPLTANITIQTNVSCFGGNNGSVTVEGSGGSLPYDYSIDGGPSQSSGTFSSLAAGTYTVTVTDATPSVINVPVTITEPPELDLSVSGEDVHCFGGSTGSVTATPAGGTAPYNYAWNTLPVQTTPTATGLTAGTYSVTVTDVNGCSSTKDVTISQPAVDLEISISHDNVLCAGDSSGSASVAVTGGLAPYTYIWDTTPVQTKDSVTDLSAGTYTVEVSDSHGCIKSGLVDITEPEALTVESTTNPASCPDAGDGSVNLAIEGGSDPYLVIWSDGATAPNRSGLSPGTYSAVVTDTNSCAVAIVVEVEFEWTFGCVVIPQVITPNNDGYNDDWKIKNIDLYPDAEVRIFNRWGKLVFSTKNLMSNPWDGSQDGKLVPTDSYHYILYLNDGSEPRSGVISVIR
jgi:large repetitive protein